MNVEPFIKVSVELAEDYLADPEIAAFHEWFDSEARRQLARPIDDAALYGHDH